MNVGEYLVDRLIKLETENAFYEHEVEKTNEELAELLEQYAELSEKFETLRGVIRQEGKGDDACYTMRIIFQKYNADKYEDVEKAMNYQICEED